MPFRETHQVYNREQGKAARREQSFRSCLVVLMIFFFLCLILLLANIPWKRQDKGKHEEQYATTAELASQYKERIKETTTIPTSTTVSTSQTTPSTTTSTAKSETNQTVPKTTTASTTEDETPSTNQTTSGAESQHPSQNRTAFTSESASMNKIVVDESSSKTPIDASHSVEKINSSSTVREEDAETITTEIIEQTWKEKSTTQSNATDINDATALTSPNGSIVSSSTLMYNTPIAITDIMTSKSVTEETTTNYPDYSSSESSSEYSKNFDTASPLSPSTNLEESTRAKYSSDKDYSGESQADIITNDTVTLTSRSDVENIDVRHSFDMDKKSENTIFNDTSSTTSNPPNDTENSTSTKYDYRSQFSNTTNATSANDTVTHENVTRDSYSTLRNYNLLSDEKLSSIMSETTEKYTTNTTSAITETITTFTSPNHSTIASTSYEMNFSSVATILPDENTNEICNTSYCRQLASKMMSYMNESANPCDDFYEYACGGFEANPLLIDVDQARRFSNYQRIKKQMMKETRENVSSTFATYYESCVQYEKTVYFNERIKMARNALNKVGKFYINDTCSADRANFTDLFAKLILHHSAFLFDVVPEVDEYHPNSFTLKIGPTTYESPFKTEYAEDLCSENDFGTDSYHVDFKALYDIYKRCKKQDEKDEIRKSVSNALIILKVFEDLNDNNDNNLELQRINKIVDVIDSVIMQGYFSHFPSKSDAREVYLTNNYTRISLKELEKRETAVGNSSAFINWTHLIVSLTKTDEIINKDIQVYFLDAMVKGLRKLKEFAETNCTDLHNAIMALYARKLYQELVLPRQNVKNHCLQVAIYLLRPEATNLYISSFADYEIERINKTTINMFEQLKETLKRNIRNATWAKGKGKQALLDKIDNLELALPPASYFKNTDSLCNDYNMSQFQNTLSENYFSDSINLMKRYRTLMYTEIRRQFDISVQIWTYYATPFQSQTKVIYGLNQIVIPYGIVDWTAINNEDSPNYISLATLGNIIALQIAHHFDELGVHYWNQTRNTQSLMLEDSYTSKNFQNYISDQRENSFQELMSFLLPFTNQSVSLAIPQLAVNKQLSQRTGLRLTYDTLDRMRSRVQEEALPWMKFHIDKLFYLAYAQTYCTKTPLTSSYVALYESEDLPNRVHVFVTMFKNPFTDVALGCQMDQCDPKDACSVFPHIYVKESELGLENATERTSADVAI